MKVAKAFLFAHVALAILLFGAFAAQKFWRLTHHRYDTPSSGFYYAKVNATFDSDAEDQMYYFTFRGQSEPRWQWRYTTNYVYEALNIRWHRFDSEAIFSEGSATLNLVSLNLQDGENGVFTLDHLAAWLLGKTNVSPEAVHGLETIYNFVLAARDGNLPQPNHHGHRFEEPIRGTIHHFQLGIGIASYVYIWGYLWTVGVFIAAMFLSNRKREIRSRVTRPSL